MITLNYRQAEKELQKLQKNVSRYSKGVVDKIDSVLTEGAEEIELRSKIYAPVDRGLLRGNITSVTSTRLAKLVVVASFYAPFLEFGTKKKFKPQGRPGIASQFKGQKRGDYFDFLNNILDWVKRVGIVDTYDIRSRNVKTRAGKRNKRSGKEYERRLLAAASRIAWKIMKDGVQPANDGKGYFFRAYDELLPRIAKNIRQVIAYKK